MTAVGELPSMLTLEEAGEHLRCSRWTLARAADRGELRVVRLGRRKFVPRVELFRLLGLESSEPGSSQEPGTAIADVPNRPAGASS